MEITRITQIKRLFSKRFIRNKSYKQIKEEKKQLSRVIAIGFGLFIITGIFSKSDDRDKNQGNDKNIEAYQEKVITVKEIERSQPVSFLSASGNYKENFWGDKINVNCTINSCKSSA